jgi:large subunit ribosomal protein L32e
LLSSVSRWQSYPRHLFSSLTERRPTGFANCLRFDSYGTNKKTRDVLPNGFKKFRVFNEADLEMLLMNNRTYALPTAPTASSQTLTLVSLKLSQLASAREHAQANPHPPLLLLCAEADLAGISPRRSVESICLPKRLLASHRRVAQWSPIRELTEIRRYSAEIAGAVSARKRKAILERAAQLNIKVINGSAKVVAEEAE